VFVYPVNLQAVTGNIFLTSNVIYLIKACYVLSIKNKIQTNSVSID